MSKIVVFISKAGVSKLDWSQICFFFSFWSLFSREVEKDVKDKAGVKIRFLTRNDSLTANQGFCVCGHDWGGVLALIMKTPFSSEKTIFLNKHLK